MLWKRSLSRNQKLREQDSRSELVSGKALAAGSLHLYRRCHAKRLGLYVARFASNQIARVYRHGAKTSKGHSLFFLPERLQM